MKCAAEMSTDNTTCVAKDNKKSCPITYLKVIDDKKKALKGSTLRKLTSGKNKQGKRFTLHIEFSKLYDAMPVERTQISEKLPCMNSKEVSYKKGKLFLPHERDFFEYKPLCSIDPISMKGYDSRYKPLCSIDPISMKGYDGRYKPLFGSTPLFTDASMQ